MFVQPIDYFVAIWFVLALTSAAYVAIDQYRNNPEPKVMKWGFVLVTVYMGPLGLLAYVLADKEPRPGEHERFVRALWKQGIGSTIHCVAGDATGIILAAVITAALGLPMWLDLIVEYCAGFAFGLFVFQSLFMKSMMGGSYWENVRKSFVPELISMNFMMAGMAPVMSFLMMGRDMRAMQPTELLFWGVMSAGVMAGFALAYPSNVWMVANGLKHGLMTERKAGTKFALAAGVVPVAASPQEQHEQHEGSARPSAPAPAGGHGGRHAMMKTVEATRAQQIALSGVSLLALAVGGVAPSNWLNMSLSARAVGGAMMPPGMKMDRDTPAEAMRDMAAVDPRDVTATYGLDARGGGDLSFELVDGVKVYRLATSVIRWTIMPGVTVDGYAFNGRIPGPTLRFREGDHVRIEVTNHLRESTTVHWHGLILPNVMDGPAMVTQAPIEQGGAYRYEFTVAQRGTYLYHSHDHVDRQQSLGLYGALIIDPVTPDASLHADHEYTLMIQEWLKREGLTYPAMPMDGAQPNYFTFNGKAFPATDTVQMRVGETLKVRMIGSNNGSIHPIHIHGGPFEVVARDGETLAPAGRFMADTVNIAPGQRYDVIWKARNPGKWLVHCHIGHHTTNNNVETNGGGGLMMTIDVQP
jgi:hypothetical protein